MQNNSSSEIYHSLQITLYIVFKKINKNAITLGDKSPCYIPRRTPKSKSIKQNTRALYHRLLTLRLFKRTRSRTIIVHTPYFRVRSAKTAYFLPHSRQFSEIV